MIGIATGLGALALALGTLAPDGDASRADFVAKLQLLERWSVEGRWKGLSAELDELLVEHQDRSYVVARVFDILDLYEGAAFHDSLPDGRAPEPESVVSGKLKRYKARSSDSTADLVIEYTKFGEGGDLAGEPDWLHHSATLVKDWTVEVEGVLPHDWSLEEPAVPRLYIWGENQTYTVTTGLPPQDDEYETVWFDAQIAEYTDGTEKTVAKENNRYLEPGKPYEVKIVSKASTLTMSYDGKNLLKAKLKPAATGSLSFSCFPGLTKIVISGRVNDSFIQGLVDEKLQQLRASFEEGYRAKDHVPEWLWKQYRRGCEADERAFPEPSHEGNGNCWDELGPALVREDAEDLRTALTEIGSSTTKAFRAHVEALAALFEGNREAALEAIERSVADCDTCPYSRFLTGALGADAELGEPIATELLLEVCLQEVEENASYDELAQQLLRASRPEAARAAIELAILSGRRPLLMEKMHEVLSRAIRGPRWGRSFEWKTEHYHVCSDIDRRTCFEVAQELETALRLYSREWVRQRRDEERTERYRVNIFSGEAGYQAHLEGLYGERNENTAGIYSPVLKQLLIWNLPDRDQMIRTVRHEGFHQYLDSIATGVPVWFDEGMAEYYETAVTRGGTRQAGAASEGHATYLLGLDDPWVPWPELFAMEHEAFYETPDLHYAQAWALVHYCLQGGDREAKERFGRYFEALLDGRGATEALAVSFGSGAESEQALAELLEEVRKHLSGLK